MLTGSAIDRADGIQSVGHVLLGETSAKFLPVGSAHAIRRDPGVILWDEGSGSGTHAGTRLQSGKASNQQNNSLTVAGW